MIQLALIEDNDVVLPHHYCRPLEPSRGKMINERSAFGGHLQNHLKWLKVSDVLGSCWWGKTLDEIRGFTLSDGVTSIFPYEVIEVDGKLPREHVYYD